MRRARRAGLVFGLLLLAAPPLRAAEPRVFEAVGAAPLRSDARATTPARDAAVRRALAESVRRVALEQAPALDPTSPELDAALGGDPLDFTMRFRIVEDRGERPLLFSEDAEARSEYVVVVEVAIDVDRVRERLARAGLLLAPAGEAQRFRVRLIAEGLEDFGAYQALRETLVVGVGVRSALPVELERGRAVLEIDAELEGEALLAALLRAAPPAMQITPLETTPGQLQLRVHFTPEPPPSDPASPAIDTSNPNRY